LRKRLAEAGFSESGVQGMLEGKNDRNIDFEYALRRTAGGRPFDVLIRIFSLGRAVEEESARRAFAPVQLDWLLETGLLRRAPDGVRATARLSPWRHLLLLSDWLPPMGEPMQPDFVMSGTSPSSLSLDRLVIRDKVGTALDLGCGAGIHALLAAAHSDEVIATDINPRALNFARMNACLNGIDNIIFELGSFFEPVRGRKFDLIVSNPPFIISPDSGLIFQNPGYGGDGVSELMTREAPAYLNDNGCAVSLISWAHASPEDWAERPCAWAAESGCDVWLMLGTSQDPLTYAANALRQTESIHGPHYGPLLDQWTAYNQAQGIQRLALGAIILRKRPGRSGAAGGPGKSNWVHCEKLGGKLFTGEAGPQLRRYFAALDFLEDGAGDEALLGTRLATSPDHVVEQTLGPGEDGWASRSLTLKTTRGIEQCAAIDARVLVFLAACDGKRTLRETIAGIAAEDGSPLDAAISAGVALARQLLAAGFLEIR
jgi:methylase of polypeptide subunit release factors